MRLGVFSAALGVLLLIALDASAWERSCPPGYRSDCFLCGDIPCDRPDSVCQGVPWEDTTQMMTCICESTTGCRCYCPAKPATPATTLLAYTPTTVATTAPKPTATTIPKEVYVPEGGNSVCDSSAGENCMTSSDCKCFVGQKCDPDNPKALPSGCVSPNDVSCPKGASQYGDKCYCKSGFELNQDKSACVKKPEAAACSTAAQCSGGGQRYCDGSNVKVSSCTPAGCSENVVEDCASGTCSSGVCSHGKSECKGGKADGACDSASGENCGNCEDCNCYDLECKPKTVGATSDGCFNPCLDVDNSVYNPANKGCDCKEGFEWNADRTDCEPVDCPDNTHRDGFMCDCDDGYMDCDGKRQTGCEVNVMTDYLHCGGCRTQCVEDAECAEGMCKCDEGLVLNKTINKCVPFRCNGNKECEPNLGEDCNGCKACACEATEVCDGPLKLHPELTDERGCRDCVGYCKKVYGEHGALSKLMLDSAVCFCGCEPGYMFDDSGKECVQERKSAVIFISNKLNAYEDLWVGYKVNAIRGYYKQLGYDVYTKRISNYQQIAEELVDHPGVKAMAYFSHGMEPDKGQSQYSVSPTIEYGSPNDLISRGTDAQREAYVRQGISRDKAVKLADDRFKNGTFGLDYAYLNVCFGLNDNKLADALLKDGGTAWGGHGRVNPLQTFDTYKKAGGAD
jgi:hypothetical protein